MALFEKHIHIHVDNSAVVELLQIQAVQIKTIMATFQDFQDQLTVIATATTGISDSTLNISILKLTITT